MDDYEKKFAEMQKYIPFLEAMIERLQKVTDKSREVQLSKMQQLHGILSDSKRKLKIETLQKCEDVLQKLHNKVEKGTSAGMNFPNNKKTSESTPSKNTCVKTMDNNPKNPKKIDMESPKIEETPASPSPPASPDDQLKSISTPIIIPTERKHDDLYDKTSNKPASPDQSETVCTKEPVIIPTERTDDSLNYSQENFSSISSSQDNDYDFHNKYAGSIKSHKRPIPTVPVSPRARRISSSIEKLPSSSAALDRESDCLKSDGSKQIEIKSPDCRSPRSFKEHSQSPSKHSKVPASLLVSPLRVSSEPPLSMEDLAELLNDGSNINSKKDDSTQGAKSLNTSKSDKNPKLRNKTSSDNDDATTSSNITATSSTTVAATTSISTPASDNANNADDDENSSCKPFVLTQEDIDREIDRRWETIDKPIIKFKRKPLNNSKPQLLPQKHGLQEQSSLASCKKPVEIRDSPMSPVGSDRGSEPRYADNYERIPRNQKTDRHSNNIDVTPHHSQIPDMNVINSAFSRLSEGDKANLAKLQTNLPKLHSKTENFPPSVDDRDLYQRRVKPCQMEMLPPGGRLPVEQDYRRDNPDYFMQRPRHHPPNREYGNQWIPGPPGGGHPNQMYDHNPNQHYEPNPNQHYEQNPNQHYEQNPNQHYEHNPHQQIPPNNYPHPQNGPHHPDRWNMGPNPGPGCGLPMERSDHHMSPQPGPNGNRGRPMMSPTGRPDGNHGPYMEGNFPEEMPYAPQIPPLIPPLMSTGPFNPPPPPPPPHRMPYPPENRLPYEPPFEHPGEFVPPPIRPQWESPPLPRNGDIHYHDNPRGRGPEVPFNPQIPQAASAPPPPPPPSWNRGHMGEMHPIRNRSKERFPLERMGKSPHPDPQYPGFNRRNDWDRGSLQNENNQKFNRESRNISERDPRFRKDLSPQEPNNSPNASITKRDPRLSKEPVQTPTESKPKGIPNVISNRDPRRRTSESKEQHTQNKPVITTKLSRNQMKAKALAKKRALLEADLKCRRTSEDSKASAEKALKDLEKMQSPLESLYGVIDTAAKTGKGYGLQKFRIPKIKRPDPPPRPPTPPKVSETISNDSDNPVEVIKEEIQVNTRQEDKKMEVSSTTDETVLTPTDSDSGNQHKDEKQVSEAAVSVASSSNQALETNDKRDVSEAIVDTSTPGKCNDTQSKTMTLETEEGKEAAPQFKDEITREWIEKMIKNSLEQGEGKKLLEQAKLLKKLGEGLAHSKKFKKIRKIIESQSESSSSDEEEIIAKKKLVKKKKRLIVSESSDDNHDESKNDDGADHNDDAADDDDEDVNKKNCDEPVEADVKETDSSDKLEVKSKAKRTTARKTDEEDLSKDSKVVETEPSEPQQEVKSPVPKPKKKPARRRNSLEMLQEDIREMFISEGVVTATGHRMCRLLKKNDGNLASADDKVKRSMYVTSSPERQNETGSEEGERLPVRRKRSMNRTPKSQEPNTDMKLRTRRTRKRPTKVSKQYLSSSDSEEDGRTNTIITRGSVSRNESPDHNKDSNESHKSKSESENLLTLRRSERVSMREPRVMIEKTDLGKIDSSKIMFDTSSDESFGIDVSELTAAVDISLHSDRQKPSQMDVEVPANLDMEEDKEMDVEKKKLKEVDSSALLKSKDDQGGKVSGNAIPNELKVDDVISCEGVDDATSMALDASGSSNSASGVRKINSSPSQLNRNEELIDDIIGGLVKEDNKNAERSCKLPLDKEDDMEDDKVIEAEKIVKKRQLPLVKRKKKRNTWQMGILSKSKKRARKKKMTRANNATSSASSKIASDNPSNNSESPENVVVEADKVEEDKVNKQDIKEGEQSLSEEKKGNNQQQSKVKAEKFIDYAWKGQERYPCLICSFNGKNIVQHYKTVHPKDEMMISRLTLLDAKRAINESKDEAFIKLSEKVNKGTNRKYTCRFCIFTAEGEKVSAMETFYEHCTTHTGEYRFKCRSCNFQTTGKTSIRGHYYKLCRKNYENLTLAVIEEPVPDKDLVYGYLCSVCNFIQLKEDNVKKHIDNYHGNDNPPAEIIRVNMSSYFDVKDNVDSESDDEIEANDVMGNDSDASSGVESNKHSEDIQEANKNQREKITKSPVNDEKMENDDKIEETRKEDDDLLPIKSEVPQNNEGDSLLEKTKLSAFVCPPDLENKEVEIQRERQKTMQELLKNYGTKFKNTSSGKGPSITDKLKDKMTNHSEESETFVDVECTEDTADEPQNEKSTFSDENETNQRTIDKEQSVRSLFQNCERLSPSISNVGTIENVECSEMEIAVSDEKSDKKLKDPLMSLEEETIKDSNSTEETSDGEIQLDRPYEESDETSDDESECELPTDVTTLLKETINTTTNVPMITTIQRLAAQLQGSKAVPSTPEPGKNQANTDSPSKPIVVPISDLRNFIEKQKLRDNKFPEYPDTDNSRSNTPKNFIRLRRLSGDKLSCGTLKTEVVIASKPAANESNKPVKILENKVTEDCSFLKIENVISLAPNASSEGESPLIDDIRKAVATTPVKNVGVSVLKKSSPNILKKIRAPIGKIDGILSRFQAIAPNPNTKFIIQPMAKSVAKPVSTITTITTTTTATSTTAATATITTISSSQSSPPPLAKSILTTVTKPTNLNPQKTILTTSKSVVAVSKNTVQPQKIIAKPLPTTSQISTAQGKNGKNYKILKVFRPTVGGSSKAKDTSTNIVTQKKKTFEAFTTMLQATKLRHLYKCMGRTCTFTSDSVDAFGQHFEEHVQKIIADKNSSSLDGKRDCAPYGFKKCAYCYVSHETWEELNAHYKKKHSFCAYQCGYCFYRGFTQSYVDLHQSSSHPGKPHSVILGMRDHHPVEIIDRRENVHPFVCKHECNKLFYVPEAFIAHLKMKHGATLSIFKCHMCPASALKAETLISHYKMHGIYKYQCLYCLFGADAPMELHHHLSLMHCNRPPKILERSLPISPVRDKDVLLQLIIRNLDETFKCSELKTVTEIPLVNDEIITKKMGKEINIITPESIKSPEIPSNKTLIANRQPMRIVEQAEIIDLLDGQGISINTKNSSNPINFEESKKIIPLSAQTFNSNGDVRTMLKLPDGAVVEKKQITSSITKTNYPQVDNTDLANEQLVHQEPELVLRYANERVQIQIANAVDPLRIPDNLNMNDEFVNMNVLDNPEFLKTAEQRAFDKFNEKAKSPSSCTNDDSEEKNNDSDIEIIECIEPSTTTKSKKGLTPIKESLKPFLMLKEEKGRESSERVNRTIFDTSNENSNSCIELSGSTEVSAPSSQLDDDQDAGKKDDDDDEVIDDDNATATATAVASANATDAGSAAADDKDPEISEKPLLTLEDIKHTGFAGRDLYKCANDPCAFQAMTPSELKGHINGCPHNSGQIINLKCIHCGKKFVKTGNLIDHLKIHGLKRFGCSLCTMRYALACQAVAHMRAKHKIASHKLVPADPTNPSPDALFMVQPLSPGERKGKKLSKHKSFDLSLINKQKTVAYGPNDIGHLPRQAIYNREVRCAVCPYTTKVRTNIIRHLQLHAKDETVPESGPVNPVPCLDKKEKMFDKMVNLASSSHQNGRMGAKIKETPADPEDELLPKFIPEKDRYVCCISDCNCLTINEDLLRCHIKALHPEETYFRCPHCPPPGQDTQSISIDKLGVHLKMHDTRLYKCSHCNHHHYHRHVVERHLTDKHPEKRPFVKVIREMENAEIFEKSQTEEAESEALADPDGNHWKCNVCDYKCVYKTDMVAHASTNHDERAQFKCTICPYKTSGKINFEQHIISKHINEPEADYTMVYERIKGIKKPESVVEPVAIDEPFDTTPLWRRDMPRIRHIRGILLEEENEKKKVTGESPAKSGKRKSDVDPSPKPAKIKPKSFSLDATTSAGIVEKGKANADGGLKKSGRVLTDAELEEMFGPYGRPSGNMYSCTICSTYSSKYRQDIRDHLYMELKYWRWYCRDCGHLAVSHSRMLKHEHKSHRDKKPVTVEIEEKEEVERWVLNLMNKQRAIMRGEIEDPIKSRNPSTPARISPPTITLEDDSACQIIPSSSFNPTNEISKTVDLTSAITKFSASNDSDDDEDDDDNALIIDSKVLEECAKELLAEDPVDVESTSKKDGETKTYVCKHCKVEFTGLRGFKIHVQINHLKRLAFICPYCDRSTNSETMMRQHIRGKHQGKPETIIKNPTGKAPELTNAFWEKEYGIVVPKKSKKRKRKLEDDSHLTGPESEKALELADICVKCGFTAINSTGLKAHMRAHAKKHSLKCGYCSFTANSQTDIWQHSEINHPESDWRAEPINSQNSSTDPPIQYVKKKIFDDYDEDIEEETTPLSPVSEESQKKVIYSCFYCKSVRSISLSTIRSHWNQYHKSLNERSVYKTGVPFKFTEKVASVLDSPRLMKCGYCTKKGSPNSLRTHEAKKHPNLPFRMAEAFDTTQDTWICKWCNEKVEGGMKKTSHHNMFHSHLPIRFKKEQEAMVKQKGYICPECPFISVTLSRMRTHVAKHADVFQCKRCSKTFSTLQAATQHTINDHSGLAAAIERLSTNIDLMMSKVSQSDMTYIPEEEPQVIPSNDIFRNLGVARKSTTKQLIRKPSTSPRAVARKSTNPLPRYPPGFIFDINELSDIDPINSTESSGWSYYGRPPTPVDYDNLNTVMVLGAAKMRVKCTKLAKLMNIDARVVLEDCKKVKMA